MNIYGQHIHVQTNGGVKPVFLSGRSATLKLLAENVAKDQIRKRKDAEGKRMLAAIYKPVTEAIKALNLIVAMDICNDLPEAAYEALEALEKVEANCHELK